MDDEIVDHPMHGQLSLKRNNKPSGYVNVNPKMLAGGKVVYQAKARLDLNNKAQTKIGSSCADARECAINLAVYLKQHPPTPLVAGKKVGWSGVELY